MKNQRTRRRQEWAIAAGFVVLAALFYAPLLFGVRAFPDGDFVHHFFPFSLFQHQALTSAHLPLWNPYTYGGHPFLADVQAATFYPISNLIYLVTLPVRDPAARFYWLQVEAVLHTALAGCFAYWWTRDLSGSRWGGLLGGVTFALSGFVTGYAPLQLAVLRTAVWLPLILWCIGRAWQQPRAWRWWLGGMGALSAAFLAGHSQTFLLIGYTVAAWVGVLAWAHRPVRVQRWMATLLLGVVTVGMTAAQWLPSVEFVRYSVRANVDYAFVSGGLGWADFWQLVLPRVLTQYSPLYVSVVGVVAGIVALFLLARPKEIKADQRHDTLLPTRVGVAFCAGLALVALLVALGGDGPLYPVLYRIAPGWAWFRGQERAALLVTVGLCGLAAYGMAALPTLTPQVRRRAALVTGAVVVGTTYAFGLLWQLQGRTALDHVGYLVIAGLTLVFGLAAVMMVATPGWSARRNAWIVALATVNLVWANAGTNQLPGSPADRVRVAPEVSATMDAVAARPDVANGLPGRVYNEYRAYDDYGMRGQVEDVWGSSPLRVARYAALFEQFPLDRMWRLLGVEHVLTWRRELFGPSEMLAEFPQSADTTYLHRLPTVSPRAWVVSQVVVADDDATWQQLADHTVDLDARGFVGLEQREYFDVAETDNVSARVTLTRLTPEQIVVSGANATDALLIVSETWLPGWEVVDATCAEGACPTQDAEGRAYFAPMRANLTLIGMWLPAGDSTFTLQYNPLSARVGLWISGVTLLLMLVTGLWRWRRGATTALP